MIDAQRLIKGRVELAPVKHIEFEWTALRCLQCQQEAEPQRLSISLHNVEILNFNAPPVLTSIDCSNVKYICWGELELAPLKLILKKPLCFYRSEQHAG